MPSPAELKQFNETLITEFRMKGGKVSGWHPLILLTTLGAKSNQPHPTPLGYGTDGDRLIIVGAGLWRLILVGPQIKRYSIPKNRFIFS
jgi:hypothetical protein